MKDIIKAVLIDDVESMRMVLKKLLSNFEKIEIIGEASNFEDAQILINEQPLVCIRIINSNLF